MAAKKKSDEGNKHVDSYGLNHIALTVAEPIRSAKFYEKVLGAKITYRSADHVEVETPGNNDAIAFIRGAQRSAIGLMVGVQHFGFRLKRASDVKAAVELIQSAGGRIKDTGEFGPGQPYVFAHDLDGYDIEFWYESSKNASPAKRPTGPSKR